MTTTRTDAPWSCPVPDQSLFVWDTGETSYCGRTAPKGDLRQTEVVKFWHSPAVLADTARVAAGKYDDAGCMPTCNIRAAARPDDVAANYARGTDVARIAAATPANGVAAARPLPTELLLQLSNYCSLRCQFCCFGVADPSTRKAALRVMSKPVLDRLAPLYPTLRRIDLLGGELFDLPFENHPLRTILPAVRDCGNPALRVKIVTNGQHLTRRWIDFLLAFDCIDIVSFSVDSVDPDRYAAIRRGGSLARLFANLDLLIERIAARGGGPRIQWTCLLNLQSLDGIPALGREALRRGIAQLDFQSMNPMGDRDFHDRNHLMESRRAPELARLVEYLADVEVASNRAEVMASTYALLARIPGGPAALVANPQAPFLGQCAIESHLGPLGPASVVTQAFRAGRDRLSRARVCFATFMAPHNRRHAEISVRDARGGLVARAGVAPEAIRDNAWTEVGFRSARLTAGAEYRIELRAPQRWRRSVGDITLRCSKERQIDGDLAVDGEPRPGSLALQLF